MGLRSNKINGWYKVPAFKDQNLVGEIGQIQDTVTEQDSVDITPTVV